MTIYTVLAPKFRDGESLPEPLDCVFIKEGFSWPALIVAAPWLIYRRMALVLIGYVVVAAVLAAAAGLIGGPLPAIAMVLARFLFALEANELRRWTLRRHGYVLVGVIEGRGREEAEIRFFAKFDAARSEAPPPPPPPPPAKPASPPPVTPSAEAGDVVGLFPLPGGAA